MPKNRRRTFVLSAAFIEKLHAEVVRQFWSESEARGPAQPRDRGLLESASARPFQSAFGEEIYPTLHEKAGALFHSLIANHPFQDGNKRTAVVAVDLFLAANGYFLVLTKEEMYFLAKETASYKERKRTHDEILAHITAMVSGASVSHESLRNEAGFQNFYAQLRRQRQALRRDPLNGFQRE